MNFWLIAFLIVFLLIFLGAVFYFILNKSKEPLDIGPAGENSRQTTNLCPASGTFTRCVFYNGFQTYPFQDLIFSVRIDTDLFPLVPNSSGKVNFGEPIIPLDPSYAIWSYQNGNLYFTLNGQINYLNLSPNGEVVYSEVSETSWLFDGFLLYSYPSLAILKVDIEKEKFSFFENPSGNYGIDKISENNGFIFIS